MLKTNIIDLPINSLVIHLKHGLGEYRGLKIIEHNNIKSEYLTILYADNVKLYVPIHNLYLIKKYIFSKYDKKIFLHKLGSKNWKKERKKIFKNIHNIALRILNNHAQRISKLGFSFSYDFQKYKSFCKNFPFSMTVDQEKAMQSVLIDMKKNIPMDRLICGDVGFGKTEIAMRAAFISVHNSKQVVILVPTTLLAQQHYNNFKSRFLNYSINIDIISRFQSHQEYIESMKNIEMGNTNILIGTHKILLKKLNFLNLGLLIIDEEHRFGVSQKEKIKNAFLNVDVLTLTATPIPRTLNMAINGIRDLSILSTPPDNRIPVITVIKKYNLKLIKKIIINEINRNGQVYYICNNIKILQEKLLILKKNIPEANFNICHGKMNSILLNQIMDDFCKKKFDVLICTSIIETGIDIPNVNSIIIENSENFGLSQLYQMKGRVGRSNIQGYAWLLVQDLKNISKYGKKRLSAIQSLKNFGVGFDLSIHDLKIRGVGELLGYNQSGHSKNIEFSLYLEMLKETIELIKKKKKLSIDTIKNNEPEINLFVSTIIPDKYISNIKEKLQLYKTIFFAKKKHQLSKIKLYIINNFGIYPKEVKNLFLLSKIKILSRKIGITYIKSYSEGGIITFSKNNKLLNINRLFEIFKSEMLKWSMQDIYSIQYFKMISDDLKRIIWLKSLLKKIYYII